MYDLQREPEAIRHKCFAIAIIRAARGARVEQFARHIGVTDITGVGVFNLVQTAAPAAITQSFPFGTRKSLKRQGPEIVS